MQPVIVVKFGGSLSKNEKARTLFFNDMVKLARKNRVVLVHGGGPEINAWLDKLGLVSKFVGGLRYTDAGTLEVVEMVLDGKVNRDIVAQLNRRGARAVGLSGKDGKMLLCKTIEKLGFVGEPAKTDVSILKLLVSKGYLPVVSSLGFNGRGDTLNVNADSLAMAIAAGLKARELVLITDVAGVLDEHGKTIACIRSADVRNLLRRNVVTGGMIPKIKACCSAVSAGIKQVWIIDGSHGIAARHGTVIKK